MCPQVELSWQILEWIAPNIVKNTAFSFGRRFCTTRCPMTPIHCIHCSSKSYPLIFEDYHSLPGMMIHLTSQKLIEPNEWASFYEVEGFPRLKLHPVLITWGTESHGKGIWLESATKYYIIPVHGKLSNTTINSTDSDTRSKYGTYGWPATHIISHHKFLHRNKWISGQCPKRGQQCSF